MICFWYMSKYEQKHIVKLSSEERRQLKKVTSSGRENVRVVKRAQVLLGADKGHKDEDIVEHLDVSKRTVERIRKKYTEGGIDKAIYDAPRPGAVPILNDKNEAYLIAVACTEPPKGCNRWTLELLRQRMLKDKKVEHISTVAIWNHLNERDIKPWREKNVVRPRAHQ